MIYLSKFDPTNLLGSRKQSITFTYPYIMYFSGDVNGSGEKMIVRESASSYNEIDYANITIAKNKTISSTQNQMLFQA